MGKNRQKNEQGKSIEKRDRVPKLEHLKVWKSLNIQQHSPHFLSFNKDYLFNYLNVLENRTTFPS